MTRSGGIGALHFALAAPVVRRFNPNPHAMPGIDLSPEGMLAFDASDPEASAYISTTVAVAWVFAGVVCVFGIALGFPVRSLFGEAVGNVVATTFLAAGFFCMAGCANALWHRLWYAPQARRRLRAEGPGGKRFARSMRRSVPRYGSLVFQALVAAATVLIAVA